MNLLYSRWIACLLAQDVPLTALLPTWDTLLAQSPSTPETNAKIEWLLDVCVALLVGVRERLLRAGNKRGGVGLWGEEDEEDDMPLSMIQTSSNGGTSPSIGPNGLGATAMNEGFVQGMLLLQRYPLESVGLEWVLNKAFELNAKRAAGFGITDYNNANGAGWGGMNVNGAWGVAAAMRNRVAGWRAAPGPTSASPEGIASTAPVPEVLVSPPAPGAAPSIALVGGKLRQYTETLKQSDAAASLSKASTNWSLAVMSAWNRSSGSQNGPPSPTNPEHVERAPAPPAKDGRGHGHGHGRSDSWAGWGATAVAAAKLRAAAISRGRPAGVPDPVAEEEPKELQIDSARSSKQWETRDRDRSPGDRSQSLSPTALARVMATTQPMVPQQRTSSSPNPTTPRSAQEPPTDYEPPPRPAFFKPPRDSWLPPARRETLGDTSQDEDVGNLSASLSPGGVPPPAPSPSPGQRFTMTLPGWSAVPPPSSPSAGGPAKKTGPKPLLLGKNRQSTTGTTPRFRGMSRQSSISSSTGSHREWELMALSPRSDTGSVIGSTARPDSGSFARSRRSVGTASVPTSAAGSLVPSEDEAVVVGLGLMPGSSGQDSPPNGASGLNPNRFSPPVVVPRVGERPSPIELKRTSSPLSVSAGTGSLSIETGSADSPRGWQLTEAPMTSEPAPVRKWELTDGPTPASVEVVAPKLRVETKLNEETKPKAESVPTPGKLDHSNSTATIRKYELTDGPAPARSITAPTSVLAPAPAAEASPAVSPAVVQAPPRKWELSDNPVPRIDSNVPRTMTADSDAADSPVMGSGAKIWPKRTSSNRPANVTLRVKTRPTSTASIGEVKTPSADGLRTPLVGGDSLVTPTSTTNMAHLQTPLSSGGEASQPPAEERTPRRKKQGQQATSQNRRSRVARGAARAPEVMSEEDGVKADAEDGEEYDDLLSAYETETDDAGQGVGRAR